MVPSFFQSLRRLQGRTANRRTLGKLRLSIELLERRELLTAFTPGNLIILQVGDGNPYAGTAPLFLVEYDTQGRVVQTTAIPNDQKVGGPDNQPITIDLSSAPGNGQLNRSYDGAVLTFGGLDSGINSLTATGSADRVIAIAGNDPKGKNFLDTTTHGQFYVGDDNRGAVAESASGPLWAVGHPNQAGGAVSQGVHYFPTPGPSLGTQVSAGANIRGATIGFDNRLYFSTAGSTQTGLAGIYTEAMAQPTNANPASDIPVVSALFAASKLGGIYLADVNGTGVLSSGDKLYFIDDGTVGGIGTGGLYVSTYDAANLGNHWSPAVRLGDAPAQDASVGNLRGLSGTVISPTEVDLYTTAFDDKANHVSLLQKWVDTHAGAAIMQAREAGNTVTITTRTPHGFTTGQRVVVDGIATGLGGTTILTDGYNGSWTVNVTSATTFTYTDTNQHGTGLATVTDQGAADVPVTPSTVVTLKNGSVTIGSNTFAAQGLRGVSFAPAAPTFIGLTANGDSSTTVPPGTPVTFVATLSNKQVVPTGLVTFIDQNTNTVLGQAPITTVNGVTSATFVATLVGNHRVTAYFAGGGAAALASANSDPVTVIEAGSVKSSAMVTPALKAAAIGLPVTLTATVTGGSGTPTGTVSFYNGSSKLSNLLGTAALNGGAAVFVTTFATADTQNIIAIYNGDDTYASSQGVTTVTTAPNATATITSSANNVPVGTSPTYTATLNGNATLGSPAGTVQFFLDGVALGTPQKLTPGNKNTATASVTSRPLSAGSHFVTVRYVAASPYVSFALDTTTATNGVAFIETAQQAFTPGNLVAVQRGDGNVNLGSSGYLVFLDEYTPSGMLVQQIALPNVDLNKNHALLLSGQNGAEGLLNRSADGYYLTLTGYDVPVGQQFVTSTFPFQFPRTIGRIDLSGNVDTSTAISTKTSSVPYNPLSVVSYDGNQFWLVSNLPTGNTKDGGILYVDSLGGTNALQIGPVGATGTAIGIAGGQLYAASTDLNPDSPVGVWQVGTGLPTDSANLASLPGLQEAYQAAFPNRQNPKQLLFFNHNDGTSNNPDTLYVADQSNGLLKFWFDGTVWRYGNSVGNFGQKLVFAGGATGVIGYVVNPGPNAQFQLYVTGSNVQGQNPNQIAVFRDANNYNNGFSSGNFSTLAFVGATGNPPSPNGNENFAGLAFVPGYQTNVQLTSSANPAVQGDTITFTATVTATIGTPTGVVSFYDGATLLGTGTLDANGVATFTISTLDLGDHAITAFYYGDVKDGISTSDVLTQTITDGGGRPSPGLRETGTGNSTLIAAVSETAALLEANHGVSTSPLAIQKPNAPATDNRLSLSTNGQSAKSAVPLAGGTAVDTFWRLLGAKGRRSVALWSLDADDDGYVGA